MEENRINPNPEEPGAAPIRLLIVDNDEALARAMEESLAKVGYECVVATSGPGRGPADRHRFV
jgi:two-component system response regulator HydG